MALFSKTVLLSQVVRCHMKDRHGKVPSIHARGNKLMSYKQQNNRVFYFWDWKPGSSHP